MAITTSTWLPINSDRQLLASQVESAQDHVKRCREVDGASSVCDVSIQALLDGLAGSGPTLTCCRMLVQIVVNVASDLTPVASDALQRALIVRPDIYPHLIGDALLYTRDFDRIRRLLRFLFQDEKFAPLWTDLHSRLVLFSRSRPELALPTLRFLLDAHHTMRAASYSSLHSGFVAAFHDEATMELVDAIFDLDVSVFGSDTCMELESQLLGLVMNRLCYDGAIVPACRILLFMFSLDASLASDVQLLVVLSWILRYHSGVQTERELRFLLEIVFISLHSFDEKEVGVDFHIAVTSLLPPLLEVLSSVTQWPNVLSRASKLFEDLQQCRRRPIAAELSHELSSKTFINSWNLEPLSSILHVFQTLTSAWSNLGQFVRDCTKRPCQSDYDVRTSRLIIDTVMAGSSSKVIESATKWMQELTKSHAFEFLPVFSTILHRLRNDQDGAVRIELLYALPCIARTPVGLTRVLRIILPLTQHPRLRAVSIRLLAQLWLVEPRSFSRLQQILLETRSHTNSVAVKRAVAASIVQICRQSPTESLTMVPLLQSLLYDKDTTVVALSIEALHELCAQGELDLYAAYQLLEDRGLRQFCVGRNPIAFKQLFLLVECDDVESDDHDGLSCTILSWLWQQTSQSTSLSAELRIAAYESVCTLVERSLGKTAPNLVAKFFSDPEITRELVVRLYDESSGRVRAVLERLVGAVCTLQLQHSLATSQKDPLQREMEEFVVTFPLIVKQASTTVVKQWRENKRPSVRDVFALSALVDGRRETSLSELVSSVTAPHLFSPTDLFLCFTLPSAWARYMDKLISEVLRQKRDSDLTRSSLNLAAFDQIEEELKNLDLGDSRVRGNVLLAKAGLAVKAGSWGHTDIATRFHADILSVSCETKNALLHTTRPAALLALGASIAALHPTDKDRRLGACRRLIDTFRSAHDERICIAASLAIAIAFGAFLKDDDEVTDAAPLLQDALDVLYGRLKSSTSDGLVTTAAAVTLSVMWPVLVHAIEVDRLISFHEHLLENSRFGPIRNSSLYCLGSLSFRLFSMGAIEASKLSLVVDVYIDELKKPSPLSGALTAAPTLLVSLRYASNFVHLPKDGPQQLGSRLDELIAQSDSQSETAAAAIIGFLALIGIDVSMPFQGARLPTDLCSDATFTANVSEVYSHSLIILTDNAHCSNEVAMASALGLVLLGTATSSTTHAMESQRAIAPGSLLRILCDSIDRRSLPTNSILSSVIRSVAEIRRYSSSVRLPLSSNALSSLLSSTATDTSISMLALRCAIAKVMLWQASYDNTLKRCIASLIGNLDAQPVCIQRVLLTGLKDVANCIDPDSVIELLSSSSIPQVNFLLTGLRGILESAVDQTIRDCVIQLLGSGRLRRLVTDIPRYAACFSALEPELIESILPVDDDVSILTRFELVRKHILRLNALIATRAFVVGPQAVRPTLVSKYAQVCAQTIPMARRLTWILDLFDLMAVSRDPGLALKTIIMTVTAWVHPLLSGDIRTLAGSLPKAVESYDDMSVDSVIRRILRIVSPSRDDITWKQEIRRSLAPVLISMAIHFPRCSPVITSEIFSVI